MFRDLSKMFLRGGGKHLANGGQEGRERTNPALSGSCPVSEASHPPQSKFAVSSRYPKHTEVIISIALFSDLI